MDTPDLAGLEGFPLLDQAFDEILRMYAPGGHAIPPSDQRYRDPRVPHPQGAQIALALHASMRLPDWWPDPDTFDPGRFSEPANRDALHRYAFAPFGGGVHKCIGQHFAGMTVKTIVHRMLRRFEWTVDPAYTVPLTWGTGPMPADNLPITVRTR